MSKTRGLILGKFAPFHKGHQRLIEIALEEVDEVNVLLYDCPNLTTIPLNVRADWVRQLYPSVNVIEGWDAPNRHEDTLEVKRMQEEYVAFALNGKKITHFFSSEYYGDHISKALGAIDRRTDRYNSSEGHGITATTIRADRFFNREFLHPIVYKDILLKVAFIGIPSLEQSELSSQLAQELNTIAIQDSLTTGLQETNQRYYQIAKERLEMANDAETLFKANEYLLYDSIPFIDHLLAIATHSPYDRPLHELATADLRGYDLVLLNNDAGHRIAPSINQEIFLSQIRANLDSLKVPYEELVGSKADKKPQARQAILKLKKRFI